MSDTVIIVLIVAIAVIIVLVLFRNQLKRFGIRADEKGIQAELETQDRSEGSSATGQPPGTQKRAGVRISGTTQAGRDNVVEVSRDDVEIENVKQLGESQQIRVKPDESADEE
jgi:FtsZ-interacting cell division protein ZipA